MSERVFSHTINAADGEVPAAAPAVHYRRLSALDDCLAVTALERELWGPAYDEAVPVAILRVTVRRGGVLLGAFEDDRIVGFAYSLSGSRQGRPIQWSHKVGVIPACRNTGVGYRLKLLQREYALEMGTERIEWTFDPLQATNAHFNLAKLGVTVSEYEDDFYGSSTVPLAQRYAPTDRFIAVWHLGPTDGAPRGFRRPTVAVPSNAPRANRALPKGAWLECAEATLDLTSPQVLVEIPNDFSEMLARAPARALEWRLATRRLFRAYLSRGYRIVGFERDLANRKGAYLLVR